MNSPFKLKLATCGLATALTALAPALALAQEKVRISFKSPAETTKYVQQHAIDVGDVPGHQVRLFEIVRTFPTNPPVIAGLKIVESRSRTFSDYTNNSGPATGYVAYTMENGDKFFVRTALVSLSTGGDKLATTNTGAIYGGTGKLLGIRGTYRATNVAEPKAGVNESQNEFEYWIEK